eukprot:gene3432-3704_t
MCLHIIDGLLTHQVVDEVRSELHAGAAPLVAFENVARSKLGTMATADVSRLVLVIGATCSACCGVVHITKGLLHLLATPLRLRKPIGLVTNVLMPTGLYGSLLGVYLGVLAVQGAVRELSGAAEPKKAASQKSEKTAVAGQNVTFVEQFASRGYPAAHSSISQEKQERSRRSSSAAADDASTSPPFGEAVALRSVKSSGIYNTSAEAVTPAEYGQTPLEAAGLRRFSSGDRDINSSPAQQSSLYLQELALPRALAAFAVLFDELAQFF